MSEFTRFNDEEIVRYLVDHFDEIGVGEPPNGLVGTLNNGIESGHLVIEKHDTAFAVVARANRKHAGHLSFIEIPPQADLMFLMVAKEVRGKGAGRNLLDKVKMKYMEDQAMELVCAGDGRRRFFEKSGFVEVGLNQYGHHVMVCLATSST